MTEKETKKKAVRTPKSKDSKSVESIIIERLLEKIETGQTLPWLKPWFVPCMNWYTKKEYRGVNLALLQGGSGEYITYKQLQEYNEKNKTNYRIDKSSKGYETYIIVFAQRKVSEVPKDRADAIIKQGKGDYIKFDEKTGKYYRYSVVYRYYTVFDIQHIKDEEGVVLPTHMKQGVEIRYKDADEIIEKYLQTEGVKVEEEVQDRAYYTMHGDKVVIPPQTYFKEPSAYYRVLFHELVHSSGVPYRLGRKCYDNYHLSRKERSQEELVAEVGSMFLLGLIGAKEEGKEELWEYNSENYVASWAKYIKDNPKEVLRAFSMAEKAKSYILGNKDAEEGVTETSI